MGRYTQAQRTHGASDCTCMSLAAVEQSIVKKHDGPSWDVEMRRFAVPYDFVAPLLVLPNLRSQPPPPRAGSLANVARE